MCGLQVRRWGLVFRLCRGGRIHFPPHFSLRSWEGKNVGCLLTLEKNPDDCFSAHLLPNGENAGNSEEMSSSSAAPLLLRALEPGTQVSHGGTLRGAVKSEVLGHCPYLPSVSPTLFENEKNTLRWFPSCAQRSVLCFPCEVSERSRHRFKF